MNNIKSNKIPIALLDDDINLLTALSILLKDFSRLEITGKFKSIDEAVNNFINKTPEVLLLDLNLKEGNSINFIPELFKISPLLKIIIFSNYYSTEMELRARNAGVKGYLLKNIETEFLFESIINVHNGNEVWQHSDILSSSHISENKYLHRYFSNNRLLKKLKLIFSYKDS